jgi:hypothetical protein
MSGSVVSLEGDIRYRLTVEKQPFGMLLKKRIKNMTMNLVSVKASLVARCSSMLLGGPLLLMIAS